MKMIEGLETRRLLAPLVRVKSVVADNRGEVVIQLNERAVGVKGAAAQLYTAGADGKLFTADDKKETVRFTYSENKKQIKLTAKLAKDTPYRVKLDGKTRIRSEADGTLLDGDFSAGGSSGDGVAGGNYEAVFSRDRSSRPTAIIRSSAGDIRMTLRGDLAPATVANFTSYANTGRYDNTFFTRSENSPAPFVIQGGGLRFTGSGTTANDVIVTPQDAAISDESGRSPRLSNTIGTMSFAKSGPNTATNQFFINLADNSFLDPVSNGGGFTAFAQLDAASLAVAQAINQKPIANLNAQIGSKGSAANAGVDKVPVNNSSQATTSLNPYRDLQFFSRTAIVMTVSGKS